MAPKFLLLAYQREPQFLLTARRNPIGWIFCPMTVPYFLAAASAARALTAALAAVRLALTSSPTVMKMWQECLLMRLPRPLARAWKRFSIEPCSKIGRAHV